MADGLLNMVERIKRRHLGSNLHCFFGDILSRLALLFKPVFNENLFMLSSRSLSRVFILAFCTSRRDQVSGEG